MAIEEGNKWATDYADPKLFAAAQTLYQTESSISQHYETMRATLTAGNVTIVGVVAGASFDNPINAVYFLFVLGLVAAILAFRLSSAHAFHFNLASKMRGIIARQHPKTSEKLQEVRKSWYIEIEKFLPINHGFLWTSINAMIPFAFAVILLL